MFINFENGSVINTISTDTNIRSNRSKFITYNCFCPNCGKTYLKTFDLTKENINIENITRDGLYILFCDECINNPQEFDERELEF